MYILHPPTPLASICTFYTIQSHHSGHLAPVNTTYQKYASGTVWHKVKLQFCLSIVKHYRVHLVSSSRTVINHIRSAVTVEVPGLKGIGHTRQVALSSEPKLGLAVDRREDNELTLQPHVWLHC